MTATPWLRAEDERQLREAVQSLGRSIPPRGVGQTTRQRETWTLARALSAEPRFLGTHFPVEIFHHDRPDFLVHTSDGVVGIEVVEAIPKALAHAYAISNRLQSDNPDTPAVMDMGHYRQNNRPTDKVTIQERILAKRFKSPMWIGNEPEIEWANCVAHVIDAKSSRAKMGIYEKVDSLELLVYEDCGAPGVHLDAAQSLLFSHTSEVDTFYKYFNALHIYTQERLLTYRKAICR